MKSYTQQKNRFNFSNYEPNKYGNSFKPVAELKISLDDKNMFPELQTVNPISKHLQNNLDYEGLIETHKNEKQENKEIIKSNEIPLKKGWIILSKYKETPNEDKEEECELINETFNQMIDNWNTKENEYNEIYGEDMFAEKFRLQPIYGYNTDTESETEDIDE